MADNVYECMFIFDSNAYARDPNGVSERISTMVEKCGGELLASRLWFEQKLAYPIKNQRKGTYWLTFFRMETAKVAEFNRECQLNDSVLRHLALKVDPRTVDLRVSQARGESVSETPAAETTEATPAADAAPAAVASDAAPATEAVAEPVAAEAETPASE